MEPVLMIALSILVLILSYQVMRLRRGGAPPDGPAGAKSATTVLYGFVAELEGLFARSADPSDLLTFEAFQAGVALLQDPAFPTRQLLGYYTGDNAIVACMALEALSRRPADPATTDPLIRHLDNVGPWPRFFALRALDAQAPAPAAVLGAVLRQADQGWSYPIPFRGLQEFARARLSAGEIPALDVAGMSEAQARFLKDFIPKLGLEPLDGLVASLDEPLGIKPLADLLDDDPDEAASPPAGAGPLPADGPHLASPASRTALTAVGVLWRRRDRRAAPVVSCDAQDREVAEIRARLLTPGPNSVLLVGDSGVGKSTLIRRLGEGLIEEGWTVFEAGSAELLAGQRFIGDLEQRLQSLARVLMTEERILWYIPDFAALAVAGRWEHGPNSMLDYLLPYIEQRRLLVIGETRPDAWERLLLAVPRCQAALEVRRILPLGGEATLDLAARWSRLHGPSGGAELAPEPVRREAWTLVQHHLGHLAPPGNLMQFLERTRRRVAEARGAAPRPLDVDDLIQTLSELSGLPQSLLDERHALDLAELRRLFERRVLGQPEAIECLVERVAMMKAGVTDPTRAQGVFLFAGPTGTGKTEIAKTLATFLFGSPERMIRIDMSELQTFESLDRILGNAARPEDPALVEQIRRQPFSVVLLDEFEKAHPRVWDLFLQVFDDGRLTDRRGNRADFRHAIIIMTTNLGGRISDGRGLGFTPGAAGLTVGEARKVIEGAFRKEFLNRIDRVVVFQPLSRDVMRLILRKELDEMTQRRGLRNRAWAIEWGDDAIEFLLTKGFTPDLGARPLKRAVERYLLSPLALTIVTHQYPKGDQFLFVRSEGDRLAVEFVDPDAGPGADAGSPVTLLEGRSLLPLEKIAFEPRGTSGEIASLQSHYDRIRRRVEAEEWQAARKSRLERMADPRFWDSDERFRTLGTVEYLDRIEHGVSGAGSLLDRLLGSQPGSRQHFPRDLVGRLAERLFILDAACAGATGDEPRDAFLLVEAGPDSPSQTAETNAFAARLAEMYEKWARRRGMELQILERARGDAREPLRVLLAVSGYAAFTLLRSESGLHLLEVADDGADRIQRLKVRVRVVPQPEVPPARDDHALREQAEEALRALPADRFSIVRRYRDAPPLVRDNARGWRTGRLDRVLGGDFDLIAGALREEQPNPGSG